MNPSKSTPTLLTRRKFLGQSACSALTTASLLNSLMTMRSMNAAAATTANEADDYKALVCIFLYGGNDSANMLLTRDPAAHARYVASRGVLGLPLEQIRSLGTNNDIGLEMGIHGAMAGSHQMFNEGNMAMLSNVGTLVAPATLNDYRNRSAAIPSHLFSHNDQQVAWQTSAMSEEMNIQQTGWGGRMAEAIVGSQDQSKLSMLVSLGGTNFFQVGKTLLPFRIGSNGAPSYRLGQGSSDREQTRYQAFRSMLDAEPANLMEDAFGDLSNRSIKDADTINAAIANAPNFDMIPDSGLGNQLRMVSKMIMAREVLGMKRQIFFVATGGFDTHGVQLGQHAGLLGGVSAAVAGFHSALNTIGAQDEVTSFTASDFGRTYDSNGRGSDHGWGGHHMISGGAVKGGKVYGSFPDTDIVTSSNPLDTGRGRWLPTTSVDQYGATLAKWFGLSPSEVNDVFPNLKNFTQKDLGFMASA